MEISKEEHKSGYKISNYMNSNDVCLERHKKGGKIDAKMIINKTYR